MTKIKHLGHIVLHVSDPVKSARWYCDLLGMEVVTEMPSLSVIFLSFGQRDHDIALCPAPRNSEIGQRDFNHLAFELDGGLEDFKAFHTRLVEQGITITGTVDHGISYGIYFLDPDGHQLEVFMSRFESDLAAKQEMQRIGGIADPINLDEIQA